MAGREIHWKSAIQRMNGVGDALFGKGVYGFFDEINSNKVVENMYITIFCSYGWPGILVWILFWLKLILANIKETIRTKNRGFLLAVCVILTYILHMYTLDTLICYMLSFAFAFFYALAHKKAEEKNR